MKGLSLQARAFLNRIKHSLKNVSVLFMTKFSAILKTFLSYLLNRKQTSLKVPLKRTYVQLIFPSVFYITFVLSLSFFFDSIKFKINQIILSVPLQYISNIFRIAN